MMSTSSSCWTIAHISHPRYLHDKIKMDFNKHIKQDFYYFEIVYHLFIAKKMCVSFFFINILFWFQWIPKDFIPDQMLNGNIVKESIIKTKI